MNKKYVLSMNRKEAKEMLKEMFNGEGFKKLPRQGREFMRVPAIASGEFTFSIANIGDGVFNLYQYED